MNGYISTKQEFLFPDSPLGEMCGQVRVVTSGNGKAGLQVLFACGEEAGSVQVSGELSAECYQMIAVPVEYNTGNGVDQGGAMVITADECPDCAVRKAPFRVYDCLRPAADGVIPAENGVAAAYICLSPTEATIPGEYELTLTIKAGEEKHLCRIDCRVYPVRYDENLFSQTNWFSICAMEQMHGVRRGTPEFAEVVRAYARSMRRVHQKVFLLWMHEDLSERQVEKPYHFDFEDMKPIIEIFFDEGFDTFETGGLLTRGFRQDGSRDMFTNDLKCSAAPHISVDSDEGYELLCCEMRDFSHFLRRNGWQDRVLFHVMDEPDVHVKCEEDLQARRRQFFLASNIVRRYLPGVKILEAVKSTAFRGGVDIMVPITEGYQRNKPVFDGAIAKGEPVWTYVCCGPSGKWLNRFLDQPVIHGRLLFWGCAANRISGYLHWGYNQFRGVPNPFEATSCYNDTGIGTNYPCGDAFIVYPGEKGPWLSLRLEAERQGAEEAALLRVLRKKDPAVHDALVAQVFRAFDDYDDDPERVDSAYEQLLKLLSQR